MSLNVLNTTLNKTLRCALTISRRHCWRPSLAACTSHSHVCQTLHSQQKRWYNAEAIASPPLEGEEKTYAPKIQQLVTDISQLTLVEVADLNELLKKTLNITDTPMMAMGAMPAAAGAQEEEAVSQVAEEKVLFEVKLLQFDSTKKIALIKELKNQIEGMNLVQSKKFVESLPQSVKKDVTKEDAEKLKTVLEAAGGTVEVD